MSYTIVSDICEGQGDCIPICPVECIHWMKGRRNALGKRYAYIDDAACIDCGACLAICPSPGAVLARWEPALQDIPAPDLDPVADMSGSALVQILASAADPSARRAAAARLGRLGGDAES